MMKKIISVMFLMVFSISVFAGPQVTLSLLAEKEVTVEEDGKMIVKRVVAESVEPGEVIFYTISYHNQGDEAATNVSFTNKVPAESSYLPDSAWGEGSQINFSADGGETYKKPSLLFYEVKDGEETVQKAVSPENYTDIQWVIPEVPSGASGQVGFQIKVK